MVEKNKIIVVMPAYNAAKTVAKTVADISKKLVDKIILVDDGSTDDTVKVARKLGLTVFAHSKNLGYGGNQKTCYWEALKKDPAVVVMLHPDYQYDASRIKNLIEPILKGEYDIMFGNRIRTRKEAFDGGMPVVKYYLNRIVGMIENIVLGVNFSEHFSGFRAYSKKVLKTVPFGRMSNDFVFDQQMTIAAIAAGFKIGETPVAVRYYEDSSSIQFLKGSKFLLQTFLTLFKFVLHRLNIYHSKIFRP